eukprot:1295735-Amphidinium_carterae.3
MNKNYTEEEHLGKAIIDQYFAKTRLTQIEKQSGHRPWINNKEKYNKRNRQHTKQTQFNLHQAWNKQLHTPRLGAATYTDIHPTPQAVARQESYKPPHRLTGKQPPIVAQLDDIALKRTTTLENNED